MIEHILPATVKAYDTFDDPPGTMLFPEEERLITRAVEKRRKEFTTARLCARKAMERLGVAPVPVLSGLRGEPLWPQGVIGSITHCAGYRAAALARAAGDDRHRRRAQPAAGRRRRGGHLAAAGA